MSGEYPNARQIGSTLGMFCSESARERGKRGFTARSAIGRVYRRYGINYVKYALFLKFRERSPPDCEQSYRPHFRRKLRQLSTALKEKAHQACCSADATQSRRLYVLSALNYPPYKRVVTKAIEHDTLSRSFTVSEAEI